MKILRATKYTFFVVTILIMIACFVLIANYSGFLHPSMKILSIAGHLLLMVLFLFLIHDLVKFVLVAIEVATWPRQEAKYIIEENPETHTRTDYLKMRISTLKAQLTQTENHRDEHLNLRYQLIATDLWLYGTYFILLMCLVLVCQDSLLYYNTNFMETLFSLNQTHTLGLESVDELERLYPFIESALVHAFNPDDAITSDYAWLYGDHTNKVGVVRLRQLRWKENYHLGWGAPEFSSLDYMPRWELPYQRKAYTDKYWHIYEPWLPSSVNYGKLEKLFLDFSHDGYFQSYPELLGYITLLARTRNNSMKVIDYLRSHNWINRQTAVVFMDFTLYNPDANIMTICNLLMEQNPFGTVMTKLNVISMRTGAKDEFGTLGFVIGAVYLFVLIQFAKTLVVTIWYEPSKLRNMWNKVDLVILILNAVVFTLIIVQESMIVTQLEKVELSSKLTFLDFRRPARIRFISRVMTGFLVCLTTLRLWKVLQFANVFQLFTAALYEAWQPLASTALIIIIFLFAFGISVVIINGNNTGSFLHTVKSISTSLCFSFGFHSNVEPPDLFHGGETLGLILYFILAFVLAQLLINIFVSIVSGYFAAAKNQRDAKTERHINFLQFLRVEYAFIFNKFQMLPCFKRSYNRRNRTVAENIKFELDQRQRKGTKNKFHVFATTRYTTEETSDEAVKQADYRRRISRLYTIATIMQTQMQLLEHLIFTDREDLLVPDGEPVDDDEDSDDEYEYDKL